MRGAGIVKEPQPDKHSGGETIQRVFAGGNRFGPQPDRQFGRVAIHEIAKVAEDLSAPCGDPPRSVRYAVAVFAEERIRQSVAADLRFIVVESATGGHLRLTVGAGKKDGKNRNGACIPTK